MRANYLFSCVLRQKFVLFLACVIGSVVAFVPTSSRAGRVAPVMAAERSKALPFLLRPAKVVVHRFQSYFNIHNVFFLISLMELWPVMSGSTLLGYPVLMKLELVRQFEVFHKYVSLSWFLCLFRPLLVARS